MLMMSCFEPALRRWRGDIVIMAFPANSCARFSSGRPRTITGRVARSSLAPHPELLLRLKAQGPNGELAILAEATVRLAAAALTWPPRSVLITGASSGIGRALALAYAAPGARLALIGRDPERLEAVAALAR